MDLKPTAQERREVMEAMLAFTPAVAFVEDLARGVLGPSWLETVNRYRSAAAKPQPPLRALDEKSALAILAHTPELSERIGPEWRDRAVKLNSIFNASMHPEGWREGDARRASRLSDEIRRFLASEAPQSRTTARTRREDATPRPSATQSPAAARSLRPPAQAPRPTQSSPPRVPVTQDADDADSLDQQLAAYARQAGAQVAPAVERALSDAHGMAWREHVTVERRATRSPALTDALWFLKLYASDPAVARVVTAPQRRAAMQLLQLTDAAMRNEPLTSLDIAGAAGFTRRIANAPGDNGERHAEIIKQRFTEHKQYQADLARWQALPWLKRQLVQRPQRPTGSDVIR